jgi:hypothetical protein
MRRRNLLISCRNSQRLNKTYFRTSKTDTSLRNKTDPGHVIQPGPSIPNDQYLAGSVTQQVHKKQNDLWAADRTEEQPEIEVPPRHPCHPRKRFTVEMMQYRRLPSWCPVRQRWGRSLNPLSSMKTIVRPSWWAFFLSPAEDLLLVALQCASHRALASSPTAAQCAMPAQVVFHTAFLLDHMCNTPCRPQSGLVPQRLRSAFESFLNTV